MTTDPKALLKRAQNGDEDAFEELFEELRATAFAVALRTAVAAYKARRPTATAMRAFIVRSLPLVIGFLCI